MNKSDYRIKSMIESPRAVKEIPNRPDTALKRLFVALMHSSGMRSLYQWDQFMRDFTFDPANGIVQEPKKRVSARGNLAKELEKHVLSWKVFIKAMRFLKFWRIRITIEAFREDDTSVIHSLDVDIRNKTSENNQKTSKI